MVPAILQEELDATASSSTGSVDPNILRNMDPEFISFYEKVLAKLKPTHEVPIEEIRANPSKYEAVWAYDSKDEPRIQNYDIESKDGALVPIRCYYPDPTKFGSGPYSVHINFHGMLPLPQIIHRILLNFETRWRICFRQSSRRF